MLRSFIEEDGDAVKSLGLSNAISWPKAAVLRSFIEEGDGVGGHLPRFVFLNFEVKSSTKLPSNQSRII